jgi:CBS domain containing-hemolysin-like protein
MRGNTLLGFVDKKTLFNNDHPDSRKVTELISKCHSVYSDRPLDMALELMLKKKQHLLPVIDRATRQLTGVITERDILEVFEQRFIEEKFIHQHISLTQKAKEAAGKITRRMS